MEFRDDHRGQASAACHDLFFCPRSEAVRQGRTQTDAVQLGAVGGGQTGSDGVRHNRIRLDVVGRGWTQLNTVGRGRTRSLAIQLGSSWARPVAFKQGQMGSDAIEYGRMQLDSVRHRRTQQAQLDAVRGSWT